MKQLLLLIFIFVSLLHAEKYISLNQFKATNGAKSFKEQMKSDYVKIKAYNLPYDISIHTNCQATSNSICINETAPKKKRWCADKWIRYRVYIPKGLEYFYFEFAVTRNSTFAGMLYFVPDDSPVEAVDFNNFVDFRDYLRSDINKIFKNPYKPVYYAFHDSGHFKFYNPPTNGGWLYMAYTQAGDTEPSYLDRNRRDADPNIVIRYQFKNSYDERLVWAKTKKFDRYGDPVENFDVLKEIPKSCSGKSEVLIYGNHEGEYIFDPKRPDFLLKSTHSGDSIQYTVDFKAGDAAIEGILNPDQNQNVTFITELDDCLQLISTQANNARGKFFYTDDPQVEHWDKNGSATDSYVRYELQAKDDNGVVLDPHESLHLSIKAKTSPSCTNVSTTVKASYSYDGNVVDKEKISVIDLRQYITTSSSSTSRRSSSSSAAAANGTDEEQSCEASGGTWMDTFCQYPSSRSTSRRSSSSSAAATNGTDEEQSCEASGGTWMDTFCQYPSSRSTSNKELSSNSHDEERDSVKKDENEQLLTILKKLQNKEFGVNGYFIHYDKEDPYGWAYLSASKKTFAKLNGMNPQTGYLKWLSVKKYFDDINYTNGKIVVGPAKLDQVDENALLIGTLWLLQNKEFGVNGYFIHYDKEDPYGWAYLSASKKTFAKLNGMNPQTGYLKWLSVKKYFDDINYTNGKIVVGPAKLDQVDGNASSTSSSIDSSSSSSSSSINQQSSSTTSSSSSMQQENSSSSEISSSADSSSSSRSSFNSTSSSNVSDDSTAMPPQ